ncbi:MAG: OadG family protein [Clostridiales Family XIII bacterium]|jgi:hypothetical protein|nr:OadG family protein [Clostridiales Family XIII bacterium]
MWQSVLTGSFCIFVVFMMLVVLWLLIRVFSFVIKLLEHGAKGAQDKAPAVQGQK